MGVGIADPHCVWGRQASVPFPELLSIYSAGNLGLNRIGPWEYPRNQWARGFKTEKWEIRGKD